MIKLIILITITSLLFISFVISLVFVITKRTKLLFILSSLLFLLFFSSGTYTTYYGFNKGKLKAKKLVIHTLKKIFPPFDSEMPDTEANKKNFREFLKVTVSPDVKNIYCFDDAIGSNADYMFSFNCNSTTAQKIIKRHKLKKDSIIGNNCEGLQHDGFIWWDKKRINELQSYSWNSDNKGKKIYKVFWYDKQNNKAYYFEYDM